MTPASAQPVFISYARRASQAAATALHEALGGVEGGLCFLDSADIDLGEPFPPALVDALLDARVVVVFAEPTYFTRDFCLLELEVASTPYTRVAARPGISSAERDEALRGIVVVLPPDGSDTMLDRFAPALREVAWPSAGRPEEVAALVRSRLAESPPTFRERYETLGELEDVRALLLEACRLLQPLHIGSIPFVAPQTMRRSLGRRFVGRATDLWRIHDTLTTRRGGERGAAGLIGSVEGGGGFGKTQLAAEYVYRHATRSFRGGIFWIDAVPDPEPQLYAVLRALDPHAPALEALRLPHGDGVAAAVARAVRNRPADAEPILFVVDNVPEPEPGERPAPLRTWCPVLGEVSVLATSRRTLALDGGAVQRLEVRELDPEFSALLLRWELAPGLLSPAEWREIAGWVGHLPLALELLNAALRSDALLPRELLERSRDEATTPALEEAMAALHESVPEGALRGVVEALSISYDRLPELARYPARLLAWMAPAAMPSRVADDFAPGVFFAPFRAILRNRHFITEVRGSGEYFGTMHRVLADFLRTRSPDPDAEISFVSGTLLYFLDAARQDGEAARTYGPVVVSHVANRIAHAPRGDRFASTFAFADDAGSMLLRWRLPETADIYGRLHRASVRALGAEHPDTLAAQRDLARAHRDVGNYPAARALLEQNLDARRRTAGAGHPETLTTMRLLGSTLSGWGDHDAARRLLEETVEALARAHGPEHWETLDAVEWLGTTLRHLGDHEGAQRLQEQVLQARERTRDEEYDGTFASLNNLANALRDQGDSAGAQRAFERAVEGLRRTLGPDHPNTLMTLHNLANTLSDQGDDEGARPLREEAYNGMRRALDVEHPWTTGIAWSLLITCLDLGDTDGADRVLNESLTWLFERDPDSLAAEQRRIRGELLEMVEPRA